MNKENTGMTSRTRSCIAGAGRVLAVAMVLAWLAAPPSLVGAASYGDTAGDAPSEARVPEGEKENLPPSDVEITKPSSSTDALMDAYNRRIQGVMEQADPFASVAPEDAFSASSALQNNPEYKKALELYMQLVNEGGAEGVDSEPQGLSPDLENDSAQSYEDFYEALLARAKARETMGQIPDVRELIQEAMASMSEDGTGVDAAVTELYKEMMEQVSGRTGSATPGEETP
ncbi:hypothetical protein [Desulfoluna butyratoxydans]|uniref:Uncharacterized protein n=1 Tax=Desulfoluna butyratoxydans TaxID=231438 RepID=A0A4U8YVP5_9BACT|nr:hypothetical protein [Desulfoluna butyratoxydans]VFQ46042.1 hypothetical protein MSL71_37050 [Desulfoluna butyratoxydans]